jgi:hypothetical protein
MEVQLWDRKSVMLTLSILEAICQVEATTKLVEDVDVAAEIIRAVKVVNKVIVVLQSSDKKCIMFVIQLLMYLSLNN